MYEQHGTEYLAFRARVDSESDVDDNPTPSALEDGASVIDDAPDTVLPVETPYAPSDRPRPAGEPLDHTDPDHLRWALRTHPSIMAAADEFDVTYGTVYYHIDKKEISVDDEPEQTPATVTDGGAKPVVQEAPGTVGPIKPATPAAPQPTPPKPEWSDYGAEPGTGRYCGNCGHHLTKEFIRVFESDESEARCCPNCDNLIREGDGTVREKRSTGGS
jgi:hypothetical protein